MNTRTALRPRVETADPEDWAAEGVRCAGHGWCPPPGSRHPCCTSVLVGWLMLHGFLDAGAWSWSWSASWRCSDWPCGAGAAGHRRWAAVLVAGAVAIVAVVGWYGYSLNEKIADIPRVDDRACSGRTRTSGRRKEPTKAVNILLMGADNPQPAGQEADRRRAARGRRVGPRRLPQRHDDGGAHPGRPEGGVRRLGPARLLRPDLRRRGRRARPQQDQRVVLGVRARSAPCAPIENLSGVRHRPHGRHRLRRASTTSPPRSAASTSTSPRRSTTPSRTSRGSRAGPTSRASARCSTSARATACSRATSTASTASRTSCAPCSARPWPTAPSATR